MRNDSIFYKMAFEEQEPSEKQLKEGITPEPLMSIEFDTENIKLANITELKQVKDDMYSMTLLENNKPKEIDKVHVLGIVSYLDDLQVNVESMGKMIQLVNDMPKDRKTIETVIKEVKRSKIAETTKAERTAEAIKPTVNERIEPKKTKKDE